MRRLARYLKPYLPLLGLSVVLLFIQAYSNLALPDYMSRIVNVGIQQGGVENAVPLAVRKSTMDTLLLFVFGKDATTVRGAYTLVEPGSDAAHRYESKFPRVATEAIYVRKDLTSTEIAALDPVMARAWLAASAIEHAPGGTAAQLANLPEAERSRMMSGFEKRFEGMGPRAMAEAATRSVRAEYEALGTDMFALELGYMLRIGVIMLLLTLIAAATAVTNGFLSARIASGLARDLRAAIFERVESFGSAEFDTFSSASLITRSTNDVMQVQMVSVVLVNMVFYAPIIGIGGIIRAIGKSSSMWWIIALAVSVLMAVVLTVFSVAVPKFKIMQKLMDRLNLVSRENLSGMMVIRAFNRQTHEEGRFDEANQDLTSTMLFVNRVMVVMMPFMMLIMNGLSVLIIWIGAKAVAASTMQVGDMMAFMQYAIQIVFAFLMLSMMFIMLPRAAVSAGRIADVLETEPTIRDPEDPERVHDDFDGTIEFRNVSFRYPGAEADALHDVSFTARPGTTTAFIGATGAGKSTVVNLIPRFYDVTSGAIYVGGKDVRRLSQHNLREQIGFVPQRAVLFSGTIESNLHYANEEAPQEVLDEAASIAQATEFITAYDEGMNASISQGGVNVSGGQKQRLSIARALVKKAPIYVFDDSFSALDFKTDANLRKELKAKTGSSTVLLVSQRVATIKNAEQIVVLDDGRIIGKGTHAELMQECETYREIATSQLTKEELS